MAKFNPQTTNASDSIRTDYGPAGGAAIKGSAGRIEGLDGLRSVAVLSVLAYHLWPATFRGGFLGVDVFFVISGFLITTLLLRERRSAGRIDLLAFWKRRARRLLPALILVVVTSISAAWLVSDELLVGIKRQVIGALTFSTNWVEVWAGTDYFAETNPPLFQTFWSLAVEEQFYLLWPVLLIGFIWLKASNLHGFQIAIIAATSSALLMAVLFDPNGSATRVYYGTDTHSFGLMIGVALAFANANSPFVGRLWRLLRPWLGFAALAGLVVMFVVLDSALPTTYRGGILISSLLSALAVAVLPGEDTIFTRICRLRSLAWVGERSYGIYLWHWPVLLVVGTLWPPTAAGPGWTTPVITVVGTFVLSEASYRWIEDPIRKSGFRATWASIRTAFHLRDPKFYWRSVPAASAAAIVVVAAIAGLLSAPEKSQAQLSVESGVLAIAKQNAENSAAPLVKDTSTTADPTLMKPVRSDSDAVWPKDVKIPQGDQIVGLGDSVMSGAAPALYARFPGMLINARPILQWHDAPEIVRTMIKKGTMRNVVILNFGTNAGFKEPESEKAFREVLDLLGPRRRIVLVNTVGISYWVPSTNETLRSISAEFPNTTVADWYSVIQERPGLLYRDRTHPNDAGTAVYADVIADAMAKLGPG